MQLSIKVRGELVSTNFEAWKQDLIAQIRSVKTDLETDADFALAELSVKKFRSAEKALKTAKSSAIGQAPDIFQLFEAIDEVSSEVRAVRLRLERQIGQRKQEIKDDLIDAIVERVRAYIERHQVLKNVDVSDYLDRQAYEDAAKRRTTVKTLVAALDQLSSRIQRQIDERAVLVGRNASVLDALTTEQQLLFQDRAHLLGLTSSELDHVIDERISRWRQKGPSVVPEIAEYEADTDDSRETAWPDEAPNEEQAAEVGATPQSPSGDVADARKATRILEALASGCDPFSGEVLPPDSIVVHPGVQQALTIAIRALRANQLEAPSLYSNKDDADSTVSAVALAEFGIRPEGGPARFSAPGWFPVGQTVAKCPRCRQFLHGMRKPYRSAGRTYHYWALVCVNCEEALEPRQIPDSTREALYASSQLRPGPRGSGDD